VGSSAAAGRARARRYFAAALGLLPLLFPLSAHAGTITVTTSFDEMVPGGTCSLREAVQTANTDANFGGCKDADPSKPDVIKLAGGDYHLSIPGTDDANANGDLDVSETLTIQGLGANATGIDGNGSITGDRAIQVSGGTLAVKGLTVYDGTAGGSGNGGGILGDPGTVVSLTGCEVSGNTAAFNGGGIAAATAKLTNSTVSGNTAAGFGGGIEATTVTLTKSTVDGNAATVDSGGGIFATTANLVRSTVSGNDTVMGGGGIEATTAKLLGSTVSANTAFNPGAGIVAETAKLTLSSVKDNIDASDAGGIEAGNLLNVTRSTISGNRANGANGSGGGIVAGTTTNIDGSTVRDNTAGRSGGGIFGTGIDLTNSTVVGNKAKGTTVPSGGGGIFGAGTVTNSTVIRNSSAEEGGGIYGLAGSLTLSRSTVADNHSVANGGGIFFHPQTSANLNVFDSTLSGNQSNAWGGALSTDQQQTTFSSATVTRNVADAESNGTGDGGGIDVFGTASVSLRNTILGGNLDTGGQVPDCNGAITSLGSNLIGSTNGCSVTPTTGDQTGTNASPVNPRLSLLAQNGGPTMTSALLSTSPAINTGNPATPGSGGNACPATDQRGVPRSLGGRCDKGAYERVSCQSKLVDVVGTNGADHLAGTPTTDGILGLGGGDTLAGNAGNDGLCGGSGNDHLDGGAGIDKCDGGPGTDTAASCEVKLNIP
jgi:CSLREA domain-containing protein